MTLRILGGAPTYLLTDNVKTVMIEHVAGVAVRHPEMIAVGRHDGCVLHTCVPYDPDRNVALRLVDPGREGEALAGVDGAKLVDGRVEEASPCPRAGR